MGVAEFFVLPSEVSYPSSFRPRKSPGVIPGIIKRTEKRVALASVLPSIRPEGEPDFFLTSTRQEVRILLSGST